MGLQKVVLANGCYYHVFNKSIAGFEIFRSRDEYLRMRESLRFYMTALPRRGFSQTLALGKTHEAGVHGPARVRLIAYCLMPTHLHLFVEQRTSNGISDFMRSVLHGYGSFYNLKLDRRGPLWESRFKRVLVKDDAHALHLARYIHLNPTSAGLSKQVEDWEFSSYHEYLQLAVGEPLCNFRHIMNVTPDNMRKFTERRADYQKSLQLIKYLLLD